MDAYATQGGRDVAELYDTTRYDLFVARPDVAVLTNDAWQHRAVGFEVVSGYSIHGGNDVAILFDSSGDDRFVAAEITRN